jgi:hypothetical protein
LRICSPATKRRYESRFTGDQFRAGHDRAQRLFEVFTGRFGLGLRRRRIPWFRRQRKQLDLLLGCGAEKIGDGIGAIGRDFLGGLLGGLRRVAFLLGVEDRFFGQILDVAIRLRRRLRGRGEDRLGNRGRQLRDALELQRSAVIGGEVDRDPVRHRAALRAARRGAQFLGDRRRRGFGRFIGKLDRLHPIVRPGAAPPWRSAHTHGGSVFSACPAEATLPVHRGELLVRGGVARIDLQDDLHGRDRLDELALGREELRGAFILGDGLVPLAEAAIAVAQPQAMLHVPRFGGGQLFEQLGRLVELRLLQVLGDGVLQLARVDGIPGHGAASFYNGTSARTTSYPRRPAGEGGPCPWRRAGSAAVLGGGGRALFPPCSRSDCSSARVSSRTSPGRIPSTPMPP